MSEPAITVRGLRRSYGEFEAVRGIDIDVSVGQVFAFLGPNGAGKTTTVEILEGYRERNGGEVSVLGVDPVTPTREWRERVGIVLQESRLTPQLTPREAIELYAGYYSEPREIDEVIELVGLVEKADERTSTLSGGQRRRVDVALALIGDPELLFLDEPTTGFDPSARRAAWDVIAGLRELGKTIFLTTHYMDEAQALADRAAIIVAGRIVAEGPPDQLGGREGARATVRFKLPAGVAPAELPPGVLEGAGLSGEEVVIVSGRPVALLSELTGWALDRGHELPGLEVVRPSLEDVYLELTGASLEVESKAGDQSPTAPGRGHRARRRAAR